jgi:predicted dehydrogenase
MTDKVRWGVLGVARIATEKVIPAMQRSSHTQVHAIASRDLDRAKRAADALGIPVAYGSYEELVADADVEAVYNPLPNHLHVPWTIRAMEHGKHVLCEKPIGMNADEARRVLAARARTAVLVQEAFMVRSHPQWLRAGEIVASGRIGPVRALVGAFSYFNEDPANIRNIPDYGGGALMDIGCYLINTARLVFRREPARVLGAIDRDPTLGTDRLTSMILDYGDAHAVGSCSTQTTAYQRVTILGTQGRVDIEIPFNAPNDRPCRLVVDSGVDLFGGGAEVVNFDTCDQYTLQADRFSRAVRDGAAAAPYPLEDSLANMAVIDAVVRSAESGRWERPGAVLAS